jgi:hypothetical protein
MDCFLILLLEKCNGCACADVLLLMLQCITRVHSLMEQSLIQAVIVEIPSSSSWDKVHFFVLKISVSHVLNLDMDCVIIINSVIVGAVLHTDGLSIREICLITSIICSFFPLVVLFLNFVPTIPCIAKN